MSCSVTVLLCVLRGLRGKAENAFYYELQGAGIRGSTDKSLIVNSDKADQIRSMKLISLQRH